MFRISFAQALNWSVFAVTVLLTPACTPRNLPDTDAAPLVSVAMLPELTAIRDTVQALVAREAAPSLAIAVAREGEILWREAFGWADVARRVPATPETIYGLGSLAKSIAATGVMTLVERGRIDLDDPVAPLIAPYTLRGYAGAAEAVRVWQILNMCAGIPHGWTTFPTDSAFYTDGVTPQELFERTATIVFPPGEVYHYANYSLGVGDRIMERVSGQSLSEYMRDAVFTPLGMENSLVRYTDRHAGQELALPYSSDGEPLTPSHFYPYGGGGYWASVDDLLRYGRFHLKEVVRDQEQILSPANLDRMHDYPTGCSELFHLGWFNDGVKLISNGNITGYNATLMLVPARGIAVAVLTNHTSFSSLADQIAGQIIDSLAPELRGQGMTPEKYMQLYEPPYAAHPDWLGRWAGIARVADTTLLIGMECPPDGTIRLTLGDAAPQIIDHPTLTPQGVLEGSLLSRLPVPEFTGTTPVTTSLVLAHRADRIVGYAAPRFGTERGSFAYAAYLELRRVE